MSETTKYALGDTVRILGRLDCLPNHDTTGRLAEVTGWWAKDSEMLLTLDIMGIPKSYCFGGWLAPVSQVEMVLPVSREGADPALPSKPADDLAGEVERLRLQLREARRIIQTQRSTLDGVAMLMKDELTR